MNPSGSVANPGQDERIMAALSHVTAALPFLGTIALY